MSLTYAYEAYDLADAYDTRPLRPAPRGKLRFHIDGRAIREVRRSWTGKGGRGTLAYLVFSACVCYSCHLPGIRSL